MKAIILGKYHYVLYFLVLAMQAPLPSCLIRMLLTMDENLKPLSVLVRVGQAVDVVGQAGRPKTITGFQTYSTLFFWQPAIELNLQQKSIFHLAHFRLCRYIPLSHILEGFVILKENPNYKEDN